MALAQKLGLRTVAEGVETEHQAQWLARLDCDELQGYLFSQPSAPQDLENWWQGRVAGSPVGITPGSAAP